MKIALFGRGRYLTNKADQIFRELTADILYICDNDYHKQGGGAMD